MAILFGKAKANTTTAQPSDKQIDLDSVWEYLFDTKASDCNQGEVFTKINSITSDVMVTLLVMVRTLLNYETEPAGGNTLPNWLQDYPVMLTQCLFYFYHNLNDFTTAFMTTEVLTALVGSLFPIVGTSGDYQSSPEESIAATPDTGMYILFYFNIL